MKILHQVLCGDGSPQLRHRTLSVARQVAPPGLLVSPDNTLTEDVNLDYIEISSIPPLPLYALLAADQDPSYAGMSITHVLTPGIKEVSVNTITTTVCRYEHYTGMTPDIKQV